MNAKTVSTDAISAPRYAGNINKMASPLTPSAPIQTGKKVEHELKITDVEGAVKTVVADIIDLDDDVINVVDLTPVNDLKQALIREADVDQSDRDPLDESASNKTEISSEVDGVGLNGSYNGPDPMGLLELIDSTGEVHDDGEEEESGDDGDSSSTGSRRLSQAERWQIWMKRCPWLLHQESDGDFAFCLYCNIVINVHKEKKGIHQHNLSLYHQERENNYITFKNSDEYKRAATKNDEVKYEFGTTNYVTAMKEKRSSEVESLNNFNWERWITWHSWLERTQPEGTIGLCKYCNVRMNVEFLYLRKRHEESKGHCEARRQYENTSHKRKRSATPEESPVEAPPATKVKSQIDSPVVANGTPVSTDPTNWCEMLPDTSPQQCRCTLCDCRMVITSFTRHLKTKVHCSNLVNWKANEITKEKRGIWAQYADLHPWLTADPNDPMLAYCHVCCRRFMYGHSEIKRKNHQKSEKHMAAVAAAAAAAATNTVDTEEKSDSGDSDAQSGGEYDATDDNDYMEQDDNLSTSQKSSNGTSNATSESKRKKNSVVIHYSWLRYSKDRKLEICKYCRVRLYNDPSKARHEHSSKHQKMVLEFKQRQVARKKEARLKRKQQAEQEKVENNENVEEDDEYAEVTETVSVDSSEFRNQSKLSNKENSSKMVALTPVPTSIQGKVKIWKNRFPWLSYKRNERRINYGWCKLCEVSVYLPSSKFASKHQRTSRHARLRYERKRGVHQPQPSKTSAATVLLTGEAKQKAAMAELQAKYDWLVPDTNDENHCYCKHCETRLPIKVFFLRQHDGSRKHADQMERLRNLSKATTINVAEVEPRAAALDVDQDSDGALSVKSECSTEEQPPLKRSRHSLEVRRILRALRDSVGKRQDERSQMEMAKDMICSSFDIVSRLRTLEREHDALSFSGSPMRLNVVTEPAQCPPRHTIDLFFDSVTQTMKTLPIDLVAEGKVKIMQIVSDLEVRSVSRTSILVAPVQGRTMPVDNVALTREMSTESVPKGGRSTFEDIIDVPGSPESISSSNSLDDPPVEQIASSKISSDSTTVVSGSNLSEITVTPKPRKSASQKPSFAKPLASITTTPTTIATATANLNGRIAEVPLAIRRILPSAVQVSKIENDTLRVVPLNKLTSSNTDSINGGKQLIVAANQRNGQQQHTPQQLSMQSSLSSNSKSLDVSNGMPNGGGTIYHKIRVNNVNKLISIQAATQQQRQQQQQQQPQQQQQGQNSQLQNAAASFRRFSAGGNKAPKPQQQIQLRADNVINSNIARQ